MQPVACRVVGGTHPVAADSWCRVVALLVVECAPVVRATGAVRPVSSAAAVAAVSRVVVATMDEWPPVPLLRDADRSDEPPAVPLVDVGQLVRASEVVQ